VKRFRGGLVFKAHRLLYHSTLGLRVIKKKKKIWMIFRGTCAAVVCLSVEGSGVEAICRVLFENHARSQVRISNNVAR